MPTQLKLFRTENDDWHRRYQKYLKSPLWQARRRAKIIQSKGRCELCGFHAATEVHHLTYECVGREDLSHLLAVCRDCHADWHGKGANSDSKRTLH